MRVQKEKVFLTQCLCNNCVWLIPGGLVNLNCKSRAYSGGGRGGVGSGDELPLQGILAEAVLIP